jgi:hypothetical protein
VLTAADRSVEARLSSIVGYLDDGAEITEAQRGLALWGKALSNWRRSKAASR